MSTSVPAGGVGGGTPAPAAARFATPTPVPILHEDADIPGAHGTHHVVRAGAHEICVYRDPPAVALCKGDVLLERVDAPAGVQAAGLWFPSRSTRPGTSTQPCLAVCAPPTRYAPPTLTVHLPIGPVLLRMAGWREVTNICGLPGCGMVVAGSTLEGTAIVAHTLHPLTPPTAVAGGCWVDTTHVLVGMLAADAPNEATFAVVSSAPENPQGGVVLPFATQVVPSTRVTRLRVQAIGLADAVEQRSVVVQLGTSAIGGMTSCAGGRVEVWTRGEGTGGATRYAVVAAPAEGRVALVTMEGEEVPFAPTLPGGAALVAIADSAVVRQRLVLLTKAGGGDAAQHLLMYNDPRTPLAHVQVGGAGLLRPVGLLALQGTVVVVSLDRASSTRWTRYTINAEIRCPLAKLVLNCLSDVLRDRALVAGLYREVLAGQARGSVGGEGWEALVDALLPPAGATPVDRPTAGPEETEYERLQRLLRQCGGVSAVALPVLVRQPTEGADREPVRPPGVAAGTTVLPAPLRAGVGCVLHVLHESMRASIVWRPHLPALAGLILRLATALGWGRYVDHYRTLYPTVPAAAPAAAATLDYTAAPLRGQDASLPAVRAGIAHHAWFESTPAPPDLLGYVHACLARNADAAPVKRFPYLTLGGDDPTAAAAVAAGRVVCQILATRYATTAAPAATAATTAAVPPLFGGARSTAATGGLLGAGSRVAAPSLVGLGRGRPPALASGGPAVPTLATGSITRPAPSLLGGGSRVVPSPALGGGLRGALGAPAERAAGGQLLGGAGASAAGATPAGGGAAASCITAPPVPSEDAWCAAEHQLTPDERVVVGVLRSGVHGRCRSVEMDVLARLPLGPALLALRSIFVCRSSPPAAWSPQLLAAVGRSDVAMLRNTADAPKPQPVQPQYATAGMDGGSRSSAATTSTATTNISSLANGGDAAKVLPWARWFTTLHPLLHYDDEGMVPPKPPRAESSGITDNRLGVDVGNGPPSIGHRLLWSKDSRLAVAQTLLCSAVPVVLTGGGDDFGDPTAQQQHLAAAANRVLALPCGRGMLTLTTMTSLSGSSLPIPPIVLCGRRARDQAFSTLDLTGYAADTTHWPEFLNGSSAALRLQAMGNLGAGRVFFRDWIANVVSPKATPTPATAGVVLGLGLLGYLEYLTGSELYSLMCPRHEATTVALLLGLAACHRGTGEKRVSGMLSLHLAPITPHYTEQDIAAGMQAAALIGTGMLYQGSCHRLMADMLLGELSRPPSDEHSCNLHSYALCTGFALGLICLCRGGTAAHLSDLRLLDRLLTLLSCTKREYTDNHSSEHAPYATRGENGPGTGIPASMSFNPSSRSQGCSKVMVGPLVDTNITAPAAAAALALMYMMTGNDVVYSALILPTTSSLLQTVSPDAALVRCIAAGLVKWDDIAPTQAWVETLAPASMIERAKDTINLGIRQHLTILHHNCRAAAMFVLGLRYAGTEDKAVRDLILKNLTDFTALKVANKTVLDPAINATLLAACCVMAGTGCAEVFSVLRGLQKRKEASYGSHMAVGMGIGLLFLGAGHRTLASTPPSVAALFMSLYPRFPTVPTDNTYHYQFIRPLYTLATIPRTLESRDADTGEPCPVRVKINGVETTTPCLLPRTEDISVEVICDEYYPLKLSSAKPAERAALNSGVFWVQQRRRRNAPTAAYTECFAAGPLAGEQSFGGAYDLMHHAVATASRQACTAPSLPDTWDVRLALAVAEFGPGDGAGMSEVLNKLLSPYISAHLNHATDAAARRAVAALVSGTRQSLTLHEVQALVWHGMPTTRRLLALLMQRGKPQQPRALQS